MRFSLISRAAAALLAGLSTAAASAITVGDLAVIGFASDDPDSLSFVALQPIPAGTVIRFTDSGWLSAGGFRANEGGIQYVVPANLAPGAVVTRANPYTADGWSVNNAGVGAGGYLLSTSGDQILTFIGDASTPTFLHAVDFDSAAYVNAVDSNTTGLPPGLTVGSSAVNLGEGDNGYYNGPTTGTAAELLAAIGNPANWVVSDNAVTLPSWSFSVTDSGPTVMDVSVPGASFSVDDVVAVTVTLSGAPAVGEPVTVELDSGAFASPEILIISNPDASGFANVTLENEGFWDVVATATVGGTGQQTSDSFTVGTPLIPPTADAGPDRTVQLAGPTVTVALADALADDAEGLVGVTYAWTPETAPGIVSWQNRTGAVNAVTDPANATITFNAAGVYALTLTVTDADTLTAQDTINITVNVPPDEDEFDPPPGYYDTATGEGATLKTQLFDILSGNHNQQSYGDFRFNSSYYDADPANPTNILLVYNRASVPGNWDSGATWDREHVWPQSLQPGEASNSTKGNLGDAHALRPCNPSINGSRGNDPFGTPTASGAFGARGAYWFPGEADKGDMARSLFYSATRYQATLTLVNGLPGANQMGDLQALLRWHYTDVPDFFERRRNHRVWEDQDNRSAFVDRPEYVWSIFGDGANDSTLYIGESEPLDGSSTLSIVFTPIIVGGALPATQAVVLNKAGLDPTYYSVTASGEATSSVNGRYNAFDINDQAAGFEVGLTTVNTISGGASGTVVIDNLDVCSEGPGQGAADGDDIISLSLAIYDHSNASFTDAGDLNELTLDFGTVAGDAGVQTLPFSIHNRPSEPGPNARLDLVSVGSTGSGALTSDVAPFTNLGAGFSLPFEAAFDPGAAGGPGVYSATYTLQVSDEPLSGAIAGPPLTLTLQATVAADCLGDADGDGQINLDDLLLVLGSFGDPGPNSPGDADGDGDADLDDLLVVLGAFGAACS